MLSPNLTNAGSVNQNQIAPSMLKSDADSILSRLKTLKQKTIDNHTKNSSLLKQVQNGQDRNTEELFKVKKSIDSSENLLESQEKDF